MKVYNLGSVNIDYVYKTDHIVKPEETLSSYSLRVYPGGKGLNQSIALSRAGIKVIHGAHIGDDGKFLIETLKHSGVDTNRIKISKEKTGHAIIQVDKKGQNSIILYAGTNALIDFKYINTFLIDAEKDDIILLQNETSGLDEIFKTAYNKGMQIVFNPSPFDNSIKNLPLNFVKYWFCNEIEAGELFNTSDPEEMLKRFIEQYPSSNLILTLGDKGSMFINANEKIYQPAIKTNIVDTTAAGDTFTGYFISAVINKKTIKEAMLLASKAASFAISKNGASESIPYINEIK